MTDFAATVSSTDFTVPSEQTIRDKFSADPSIPNFKRMLKDYIRVIKPDDAKRNECVVVFTRKINPSSELFKCVTRVLRTSTVDTDDVLGEVINDLLERYTPTNQELKEFLDVKLCYRSLKMYLERGLTISDSVLVKIMNYIVDAADEPGFPCLYNATFQYVSMMNLCKKYGYILEFTKPEKSGGKRKAMRTDEDA